MADDRMKNDDLQRNMGGAGRDEGQNPGGQQSPGRSGQGGQQGGQQGQQGGQHAGGSQQGNFGSGQNERNLEDDDLGAGGAGQQHTGGGQGRGGQNR